MIIHIDEKSQGPAHENITMHKKSHTQLNLLNDPEKQINDESTLAVECQQFNLRYIPLVDGKNSKRRYRRRRKVKNQVKVKLKKEEKSKDSVEDYLMEDCQKLQVQYIPPVDGENHNQCNVRRRKIRKEINPHTPNRTAAFPFKLKCS